MPERCLSSQRSAETLVHASQYIQNVCIKRMENGVQVQLRWWFLVLSWAILMLKKKSTSSLFPAKVPLDKLLMWCNFKVFNSGNYALISWKIRQTHMRESECLPWSMCGKDFQYGFIIIMAWVQVKVKISSSWTSPAVNSISTMLITFCFSWHSQVVCGGVDFITGLLWRL